MIEYIRQPDSFLKQGDSKIACFHNKQEDNIDETTVESFGEEWGKFDAFDEAEIEAIGNEYFDIVPEELYGDKTALDVGCGSGRWTLYAAKRFESVEAIDPSNAVIVAHQSTKAIEHVRITKAGVDQIPFPDESFDFVFSLGVLHHIPDTKAALIKAVKKVKKGGHFLVYLYYSLDNRGVLFKSLFWASNIFRWTISKLPSFIKKIVCDFIAFLIYLPFVLVANIFKAIGLSIWKKVPLSYYVGKSLFVIRNDALDRFGTPLEQRFSKKQIEQMMREAGLINIRFSENTPFWHAIGEKA